MDWNWLKINKKETLFWNNNNISDVAGEMPKTLPLKLWGMFIFLSIFRTFFICKMFNIHSGLSTRPAYGKWTQKHYNFSSNWAVTSRLFRAINKSVDFWHKENKCTAWPFRCCHRITVKEWKRKFIAEEDWVEKNHLILFCFIFLLAKFVAHLTKNNFVFSADKRKTKKMVETPRMFRLSTLCRTFWQHPWK